MRGRVLGIVSGLAAAVLVFSVSAGFVARVRASDAPDSEAAGKRWWAHIEYLASDELQGRLTGSEGYQKGADYVAEHFKEYGLKPAGVNTYFQPVKFDVQRTIAAKSTMVLTNRSGDQPLDLAEDVLLGNRLPQPEQIDAPLVFIGYGLHIPEANYDDFAAQDLKGKVLVMINGGPAEISAALKSNARGSALWPAVEKAGALGVISIPIPKAMDIPWSRMKLLSPQSGMRLAAKDMQEIHGTRLTATFNPANAEKLFAGSGHTFSEVLALAEASKPIPHFSLAYGVRASVVTETEHVESPNIIAVLPGNDPKLAKEYVAISAHLDHLGVGEPINGDKIYHGAMDDASGVASVLEIARQMHETQPKLKRSVLFVVFTAEEKGLLGSYYFATHPTVPKGAIAADLNMDMPLPLFPFRYLLAPGLDESTLSEQTRAVAKAANIEVIPDPYPDRNTFIRTDQYSFVKTGVPAVALKFGFIVGSPEQKTETDWRHQRYHSPADNLQQPVDLAAAANFDSFVLALAERVANDDARPTWKPTSFFKRFAAAHH